MSTTVAPVRQQSTPHADVERALEELQAGKERLSALSMDGRIELARKCLEETARSAEEWVELSCLAKGIAADSTARAEEVAGGPTPVLRYLQLLIQSLEEIDRDGRPNLSKRISKRPDGRLSIRVLPDRGLYDQVAFVGMKAHTWLFADVDEKSLTERKVTFDDPRICVVLGAGNASSIPVTDTFTKIFQENQVVLLKMNPVNDYLGPIFERAMASLIEAGLLRVVYGGADVGAAALEHETVDEVHITGSAESHDAIVWGPRGEERDRRMQENDPRLKKRITSELGNVSPWIIAPVHYSPWQLSFQAENVAGSITNNASFNCVATKVIVTWKQWRQREEFLDKLEQTLEKISPRQAYYPGACDRYRRFADTAPPEDEKLPWKILRDVEPGTSPLHFEEESFVCVCVETSLEAASETEFLEQAVDFANEKLWGTLCAAITVPEGYRKQGDNEALLQSCIEKLQYGAVGINQWPALVFAIMSAPWGGYPGSELNDVRSGIGWVHNTLFLPSVEKTVLESPVTMSPKPLWFPTHPNPEPVAWKLFELYRDPSLWNLTKLFGKAVSSSVGF